MRCCVWCLMGVVILISLAGVGQVANATEYAENLSGAPGGWSWDVRSGYTHYTGAAMEGGGQVRMDRTDLAGAVTHRSRTGNMLSLTARYRYLNFDFDSPNALSQFRPWSQVHLLSLSAPVRIPMKAGWQVLAVPIVRFSAERLTDWSNAFTGGGVAGATYRIGTRLTVGGGGMIMSQLDDETRLWPVLLANWQASDQMQFLLSSTGDQRELACRYKFSERWNAAAAIQYYRNRFRLSPEGPVPSGVGQESGIPIGLTIGFCPKPGATIQLASGMVIERRLRLDKRDGRQTTEVDADPAAFIGIQIILSR